MNRISAQANKLWQLVSSPDTYASYKQTILLTWDIIKETALLVWLVVCLVLVAFEWLWRTGFGAGRSFRNWINSLEGTGDQAASEAGKALLSAGKTGLDFTIIQAKTQLGIPVETQPTAELLEVSAPAPKPAAVSTPASGPSSSPPPSTGRSTVSGDTGETLP